MIVFFLQVDQNKYRNGNKFGINNGLIIVDIECGKW